MAKRVARFTLSASFGSSFRNLQGSSSNSQDVARHFSIPPPTGLYTLSNNLPASRLLFLYWYFSLCVAEQEGTKNSKFPKLAGALFYSTVVTCPRGTYLDIFI